MVKELKYIYDYLNYPVFFFFTEKDYIYIYSQNYIYKILCDGLIDSY